MPGRFPITSTDKAIRALQLLGCWIDRYGKGDHIIVKRKAVNGELGTSMPRRKELSEATLRSALHDLQIDEAEYIKAWHKVLCHSLQQADGCLSDRPLV